MDVYLLLSLTCKASSDYRPWIWTSMSHKVNERYACTHDTTWHWCSIETSLSSDIRAQNSNFKFDLARSLVSLLIWMLEFSIYLLMSNKYLSICHRLILKICLTYLIKLSQSFRLPSILHTFAIGQSLSFQHQIISSLVGVKVPIKNEAD